MLLNILKCAGNPFSPSCNIKLCTHNTHSAKVEKLGYSDERVWLKRRGIANTKMRTLFPLLHFFPFLSQGPLNSWVICAHSTERSRREIRAKIDNNNGSDDSHLYIALLFTEPRLVH